jgi:hypothetical protein
MHFRHPVDPASVLQIRERMAGSDLHLLIKSMTRSQRRYFTLNSNVQEGEKNYLRLFHALDAMEEYDEKLLIKKLKREDNSQRLHVEKQYLYEAILKSLRNFHKDMSVKMQVRTMLADIEILFTQGLYAQCEKRIHSVMKICGKQEIFFMQLEALYWLNLVNVHTIGSRDYVLASKELIQQKQECLDRISEVLNYERLQQQVYGEKLRIGRTRSDADEPGDFMESPLIKGEVVPKAAYARLLRFAIVGTYSDYMGDYERSYDARKNAVRLMEEEFSLDEWLDTYLASLNNYTVASLLLKKYDEVFECLEKMKATSIKYPEKENLRARSFVRVYVQGLIFCTEMGIFTDRAEIIRKINLGLEKYEGKIEPLRLMQLYFKVALYNLAAGYPAEALPWVNRILNNVIPSIPREGYCDTHILNLIIHYELNNLEQLPYYIKSAFRFILKSERLFGFERIVLDLLRRLMRDHTGKEELKVMFKETHELLAQLVKNPNEARFLENFDFISWLKSKIENRPLATVHAEKKIVFQVDEDRLVRLLRD